ncbi:MAG: hypothetical protein NC092_00195 [Butyrivibrio sp.]|nr:hypothetical protein [Muribaculum sp.]MCM1551094.1 hypothetical protein [Butyrivibrio sp.]
MTNDHMMVEIMPTGIGRGGSFVTLASFDVESIGLTFENIDVKVDTGCSVSTLSLQRYKLSEEFCRKCKEQDIKNDVSYMLSYGIESGGRKHKKPLTLEDKMDCTAMKFLHDTSNFYLNGVRISVQNIYINFDRANHMLIGMDILDKLDIHMGESKINGKYLFIACPKDDITLEYKSALKEHFGLVGI